MTSDQHTNSGLLFAEQLQLPVSAGETTSTVRVGFRDYKPGPVLGYCPITKWEQELYVLEVRFTEARNVEAELMGYTTQAEFYEDMRSFGEKYADFGPNSDVTVLYFVLPSKVEAERKEVDELNKMQILPGDEDDVEGYAV
jgi:hypothetical protein